jgi:hypothetical protein
MNRVSSVSIVYQTPLKIKVYDWSSLLTSTALSGVSTRYYLTHANVHGLVDG